MSKPAKENKCFICSEKFSVFSKQYVCQTCAHTVCGKPECSVKERIQEKAIPGKTQGGLKKIRFCTKCKPPKSKTGPPVQQQPPQQQPPQQQSIPQQYLPQQQQPHQQQVPPKYVTPPQQQQIQYQQPVYQQQPIYQQGHPGQLQPMIIPPGGGVYKQAPPSPTLHKQPPSPSHKQVPPSPKNKHIQILPQPKEWTCPACTFLNKPLHLTCGTCGTMKPQTPSEILPPNDVVHPQPQPQPSPPGPPQKSPMSPTTPASSIQAEGIKKQPQARCFQCKTVFRIPWEATPGSILACPRCRTHNRLPAQVFAALKKGLPEWPKWLCAMCTYENVNHRMRCEICNSQRPDKPQWREQHSQQQQSSQQVEGEVSAPWNCSSCTYENPKEATKCTMCGAVKPTVVNVYDKWACPNCTFINPMKLTECGLCLEDRPMGIRLRDAQVLAREMDANESKAPLTSGEDEKSRQMREERELKEAFRLAEEDHARRLAESPAPTDDDDDDGYDSKVEDEYAIDWYKEGKNLSPTPRSPITDPSYRASYANSFATPDKFDSRIGEKGGAPWSIGSPEHLEGNEGRNSLPTSPDIVPGATEHTYASIKKDLMRDTKESYVDDDNDTPSQPTSPKVTPTPNSTSFASASFASNSFATNSSSVSTSASAHFGTSPSISSLSSSTSTSTTSTSLTRRDSRESSALVDRNRIHTKSSSVQAIDQTPVQPLPIIHNTPGARLSILHGQSVQNKPRSSSIQQIPPTVSASTNSITTTQQSEQSQLVDVDPGFVRSPSTTSTTTSTSTVSSGISGGGGRRGSVEGISGGRRGSVEGVSGRRGSVEGVIVGGGRRGSTSGEGSTIGGRRGSVSGSNSSGEGQPGEGSVSGGRKSSIPGGRTGSLARRGSTSSSLSSSTSSSTSSSPTTTTTPTIISPTAIVSPTSSFPSDSTSPPTTTTKPIAKPPPISTNLPLTRSQSNSLGGDLSPGIIVDGLIELEPSSPIKKKKLASKRPSLVPGEGAPEEIDFLTLLKGDTEKLKHFTKHSQQYAAGKLSPSSYYYLIVKLFGQSSLPVVLPRLLQELGENKKREALRCYHVFQLSRRCGRCTQTVYQQEEVLFNGVAWHRWCFKCFAPNCPITLTINDAMFINGQLFCQKHKSAKK